MNYGDPASLALTAEQVEIAKSCGVSKETYAEYYFGLIKAGHERHLLSVEAKRKRKTAQSDFIRGDL